MAARKPEFITFTGADDRTSVAWMKVLPREYPIEWGILFSPTRQGVDPRYPALPALLSFADAHLRMSAHLCGDYSRKIMGGQHVATPIDLIFFRRIQVNHAEPSARRILDFCNYWVPRGIAQARGKTFPPVDRLSAPNASIDWLFDPSGGRGVEQSTWPPHPGRLVDSAGGIGPHNPREGIEAITSPGSYWIDMESKVRTDEVFDLA